MSSKKEYPGDVIITQTRRKLRQHHAAAMLLARRQAAALARRGGLGQQLVRRASTNTPPPSLRRFPQGQTGLYDAAREADSCGVGMVASLKGVPSHSIVKDANTMLVRMAHRGGCGCDPASGDGAGILTGMPDSFLRKAVKAELGAELPPLGQYAAGVLFFPKDAGVIAACKAVFEDQMRAQGLGLIGWRPLPVDNSALGPTSLESEPHSEMLLVAPKEGAAAQGDFARELYKLRVRAAANLRHDPANDDFYVNSLNTSTLPSYLPWPPSPPHLPWRHVAGTVVYKGQLTPEQVWGYFKDLQDPEYASHLALVHSRFSTNTFPSWPRAQPFRVLCHNGEINTLRGNKNMMRSREVCGTRGVLNRAGHVAFRIARDACRFEPRGSCGVLNRVAHVPSNRVLFSRHVFTPCHRRPSSPNTLATSFPSSSPSAPTTTPTLVTSTPSLSSSFTRAPARSTRR